MADDAPPPAKKRVVGRPFPRGKSPNPGGITHNPPRLKKRAQSIIDAIATQSPITVEEAIAAAGPACVRYMVEVMTDAKEETRDRLKAATSLLDKLKANAVAKSVEENDEEKKKVALEQFVEAMKAKPPGGGDAPS